MNIEIIETKVGFPSRYVTFFDLSNLPLFLECAYFDRK